MEVNVRCAVAERDIFLCRFDLQEQSPDLHRHSMYCLIFKVLCLLRGKIWGWRPFGSDIQSQLSEAVVVNKKMQAGYF